MLVANAHAACAKHHMPAGLHIVLQAFRQCRKLIGIHEIDLTPLSPCACRPRARRSPDHPEASERPAGKRPAAEHAAKQGRKERSPPLKRRRSPSSSPSGSSSSSGDSSSSEDSGSSGGPSRRSRDSARGARAQESAEERERCAGWLSPCETTNGLGFSWRGG